MFVIAPASGERDIRGVEAAAQADFEDRDVHAAPAEQLERRRRRDLEERRRRLQPAVRRQPIDQDAQVAR